MAVKVNPAQLGARIEAYVETKAAAETLKACIAHSKNASLSKVPLEVTRMIIDELQDSTYRNKIPQWVQGCKCATGECSPRDHLTGSQLREFLCEGSEGYTMDGLDPIEDEEIFEEHRFTMEHFLRKIGALTMYPDTMGNEAGKETYNFSRCIKIFTHDFAIIPHFSVQCYFNPDRASAMLESADVIAYLAEPISTALLGSEAGPNYASLAVNSIVDPTAVTKSLSDVTTQRFKHAVIALRLEQPHRVIIREVEHWTADIGIEEEVLAEDEEKGLDRAACGESIASPDNSTGLEEVTMKTDTANLEREDLDDQKSSLEESVPEEEEMRSETSSFVRYLEDGSMTYMTYVPTREHYCIECGKEDCAGAFAMTNPQLMMLGCGEFPAYSVFDPWCTY
ncbi:MAG: hypothetical protein Q9183_004584 [Haloplaca sp. 2 TL-2023]